VFFKRKGHVQKEKECRSAWSQTTTQRFLPEKTVALSARARSEANPLVSTEAVDMNGIFQMQGGKNWILPK
jgi:hypothetical protein